MVERIKQQKVGLGTDEGVTVGPLTHERAVEKAMRHIKGISKLPAFKSVIANQSQMLRTMEQKSSSEVNQ